jgi:sigma-B regulation protein RsbU (phosphoserine phosphatase)
MTRTGGRPDEVLVVDDELLGRRLIRQHVATLQCLVRECASGEEALALAWARPPDVVLVDVEMPGLNGFEVCRRLTSDPRTTNVPVIVVTARAGIEDLERGFEAGATDYIRKPFNPRELVARVRTALELKRRGDSLRRWKERLTHDLALAGALQRTIFPQRPHLGERLRVHPVTRSSIEVGGDFFGVIQQTEQRLAVYVGDVAGHGVGPAMAATLLKTSLDELLRDHPAAGPAHVANELHRAFLRQIALPNLFATLLLCIVDPARRVWRCLSCGHPAPVFPTMHEVDAVFAERGGVPLGFALAPETPYREADEVELTLDHHGVGLLVTDGLLEAVPGDDDSGRRVLAGLLDEWTKAPGSSSASEYVFRRLGELGHPIDRDDCTALAIDHVHDGEILLATDGLRPSAELADVARFTEKALLAAGGGESLAWAAQLIVLEQGANAVRHGGADAGAAVGVQIFRRRGCAELLITDSGRSWDIGAAPVLDLGDGADHGRGIAMMRRIAARIEHNHAAGRNVTLFTVPWDWQNSTE